MKKVTMRKLASRIAKAEGRRSQVKIGDIREILAILSDMIVRQPWAVIGVLIKNGERRYRANQGRA